MKLEPCKPAVQYVTKKNRNGKINRERRKLIEFNSNVKDKKSFREEVLRHLFALEYGAGPNRILIEVEHILKVKWVQKCT